MPDLTEKLQSGFIVWSPTGATPPRKIHETALEALSVAGSMSLQHPGQTFHALAIIGTARTEKPAPACATCGRVYEEVECPF